jgi:hypothetical protein
MVFDLGINIKLALDELERAPIFHRQPGRGG